MFKVMGLDHIVLKTDKINTMLEFYCQILGCQIEKTQPDFRLTQLRAGINMLDIIEVDDAPAGNQHNLDHFCLQINPFDYENLKQYFDSKGINIYRYGKRIGAQGIGYSFYLKDPQGNELELKEYVSDN